MRALPVLLLAAAPAAAENVVVTYACEHGIEVHAAYVNDVEPPVMVAFIEGELRVLEDRISGSGARYGPPEGEAGYVVWSRGAQAIVLYADGTGGEETLVLDGCAEVSGSAG